MDDKQKMNYDAPAVNKSPSYHIIEYSRNRNYSLYMISCGSQRCLPGYTYPHNAREGYHLHVVLSGKGFLRCNGGEFHIHERQMFLLKDREEAFYQADHEDPWRYVWITYSGAEARRYMEFAGFTDGVYVVDCSLDVTLFQAVVNGILERPHLNLSSAMFRMSQAYRFLSLAIESNEKNTETMRPRDGLSANDYVDYAVRFIQANYARIRINDVANYISINRTYFSAIFKKKMLMSPQEYLMQVRMDKSRELLLSTDVPIYVVAQEVGYSDQLAFSKIFKKRYGISPEQYRKKHLEDYSVL